MPKWLFSVLLLLVIAGCQRVSRAPALLASVRKPLNENYLDVEPGWRLRVIVPILKSGGTAATMTVKQGSTGEFEARASSDFLGYETQYYSARRAGPSGGVRVKFASGTIKKDGADAGETAPLKNYFPWSTKCRYLRLVYLLRVSQTQHDMAVLWARSAGEMQQRWERVQSDPNRCGAEGDWCYWIAKGVAVRAEKQDGGGRWSPAQ